MVYHIYQYLLAVYILSNVKPWCDYFWHLYQLTWGHHCINVRMLQIVFALRMDIIQRKEILACVAWWLHWTDIRRARLLSKCCHYLSLAIIPHKWWRIALFDGYWSNTTIKWYRKSQLNWMFAFGWDRQITHPLEWSTSKKDSRFRSDGRTTFGLTRTFYLQRGYYYITLTRKDGWRLRIENKLCSFSKRICKTLFRSFIKMCEEILACHIYHLPHHSIYHKFYLER